MSHLRSSEPPFSSSIISSTEDSEEQPWEAETVPNKTEFTVYHRFHIFAHAFSPCVYRNLLFSLHVSICFHRAFVIFTSILGLNSPIPRCHEPEPQPS